MAREEIVCIIEVLRTVHITENQEREEMGAFVLALGGLVNL